MLAMRPKHKRWLIFIIIVLSVYTGYRVSGFKTKKDHTPLLDMREAQVKFDRASNYRKTTMNYVVSDFNIADSTFKHVLGLEGVTTKFFDSRNNSLVAMLEIPPAVNEEALAILNRVPGLADQRTSTTPRSVTERTIDVNSHIGQNEMILKRLQQRVSSPHLTTREIGELQGQIRSIQTTIDSLSSMQAFEEERAKEIVFATIRGATSPMQGGTFVRYRNLTFAVTLSLIGYTALIILAYLCFEALSKLMNVIGIKSSKEGSKYGGYKYGQYGYNSKPKRKKKRVVIRKGERDDYEDDYDDENDSNKRGPDLGP